MSDVIVGIDIAEDSFVAGLDNENNRTSQTFQNTEQGFDNFDDWLEAKQINDAWLCMEATGRRGIQLAMWAINEGHKVSRVNPARPAAFAESELSRNKADKPDARLLARFGDAHRPTLWEPTDAALEKLQQYVGRLQMLQQTCNQEKNRLQAPHFCDEMRERIIRHIRFIEQQIEALWEEIEVLLNKHNELEEPLEYIHSIPGIGHRTAVKLIAEIGDIERFDSAKKLAGHAGVTPANNSSGKSPDDPASMSKIGPPTLRKILYMPALSARTHNPVVRQFCDRLEQDGKDAKTVIGAAMHKLIRIVYGVWKNEQHFDPDYAHAA